MGKINAREVWGCEKTYGVFTPDKIVLSYFLSQAEKNKLFNENNIQKTDLWEQAFLSYYVKVTEHISL